MLHLRTRSQLFLQEKPAALYMILVAFAISDLLLQLQKKHTSKVMSVIGRGIVGLVEPTSNPQEMFLGRKYIFAAAVKLAPTSLDSAGNAI